MAGVFLSVDSVQGNGKGMNPYGYVGGNPETKNDPTGQKVMCPDPTCSGGGGNSSTGHGTGRGPVSVCDPTVDACTSSTSPGPSSKKPAPHGLTPTTSPNALLGICYADPACYAALQNYYGLLEREGLVNTIGVVGSFLEMALGFAEDNPELVQQAEDELQTLSEGEGGITGFGCSFTAQTLVSTDHGKQPIATVHDDEKVLAYNPKTRKMEWQPVVHVWIHTDNDLVDLTITTPARQHQGKGGQEQQTKEVIHTNQKHPFLTIEDGFLPVGQIKVGMHVVRADGRIGVISGWKVVPGVKMMYNLEVAQDHTFTVGSGQWVVHNCAVGPFDNAIQKLLKSSNAGDRLEAELAQLVQGEGYTLTNVHTNVNGPTGTVGDYDVTTPDVILEAKSGQSWDSRATRNVNKLLGYGADGAIMNPDGKPVLVYAPSMPEDKVLWIQKTGAYVAQNPEQLFILLWYLSPPH